MLKRPGKAYNWKKKNLIFFKKKTPFIINSQRRNLALLGTLLNFNYKPGFRTKQVPIAQFTSQVFTSYLKVLQGSVINYLLLGYLKHIFITELSSLFPYTKPGRTLTLNIKNNKTLYNNQRQFIEKFISKKTPPLKYIRSSLTTRYSVFKFFKKITNWITFYYARNILFFNTIFNIDLPSNRRLMRRLKLFIHFLQNYKKRKFPKLFNSNNVFLKTYRRFSKIKKNTFLVLNNIYPTTIYYVNNELSRFTSCIPRPEYFGLITFKTQVKLKSVLNVLKSENFLNSRKIYNFPYKNEINPGAFISYLVLPFFKYLFNINVIFNINFDFIFRLESWDLILLDVIKTKLRLYHFQFTTIFFLNEFIDILYLSLKIKNFRLLLPYLNRILKKLVIWDHKKFLLFVFNIFSEHFWPIFKDINVIGLRIIIKGKVGVGGDSRKRSISVKLGRVSSSYVNLNSTSLNHWLDTTTGCLGIRLILLYDNS